MEEGKQQFVNLEKATWGKYTFPRIEYGTDQFTVYTTDGRQITKEMHTMVEDKKTGKMEKEVVRKLVARTPFIIVGKSNPLENGTVYYTFRYGKNQKEFTVPKSELAPRQKLKGTLARYDINVTDEMIEEAEEYISIYIYILGDKLYTTEPVTQNGWNKDCTMFAMGKNGITINGIQEISTTVTNPKHSTAFHELGDEREWLKHANILLDYDVAYFLFSNGMLAPLLKLLNIEPQVTTHNGRSGRGKSLLAHLISSTMGNYKSLELVADSTEKAIIAHASGMNDMPIDIEEATTEKAAEVIAKAVYELANGTERGRCRESGELRDDIKTFRVITHITCERPIREKLNNAGGFFRLKEVSDLLPEGLGDMTNKAGDALIKNYGFFYPRYIQHIIKNKDALDKLYRKAYSNIDIDHSIIPDESRSLADRNRYIFAGILTAGYLCNEVLNEMGLEKRTEESIEKIINKYFKMCVIENPVEPNYIRALRVVSDYVTINKNSFIIEETTHRHGEDIAFDLNPKGLHFGKVTSEYIDIIASQFNKVMKEYEFSPMEIKRSFYNEGISVSNRPDGVTTSKVFKTSVVRIKRKSMDAKLGNDIEETGSIKPTENIRFSDVMRTIKFLVSVRKSADISMVENILGYDVTEYIRKLEVNGSILKRADGKYI